MTGRKTTFKGNPLTVTGREVHIGDTLPRFRLTGTDMNDVTEKDFAGSNLVISVVPSLDTPVCALQTKRFNQEASSFKSARILTVSMDLPFAQKRWCGAEGVENIVTASDYKYRRLGEDFGAYIQELGLLARAVFIADRQGVVQYVQYVSEVTEEPRYDEVLSKLKTLI